MYKILEMVWKMTEYINVKVLVMCLFTSYSSQQCYIQMSTFVKLASDI